MEYKGGIYDLGYVFDKNKVITDLDARLDDEGMTVGLDRDFHKEEGTPIPEYFMALPQMIRLHNVLGILIIELGGSVDPTERGWYVGSEFMAVDDMALLRYLRRTCGEEWGGHLANFMEGEGFSLQSILELAMHGDNDSAIASMEETLMDGIEYCREEGMEFHFNGVEYIWIEGE